MHLINQPIDIESHSIGSLLNFWLEEAALGCQAKTNEISNQLMNFDFFLTQLQSIFY